MTPITTQGGRVPRTFDLTRRAWGHNFNIVSIIDKGAKLKLAVWLPHLPSEGDFLIMPNQGDTTRYRVDMIKHCHNPNDMAFVDVSFAPRPIPASTKETA